MNKRILIELLEELTGSQNDNERTLSTLLTRCFKASKPELEEFLDDLSQFMRDSPEVYIAATQTFISYIYNESSRIARRRYLQEIWASLPNFISKLITVVIMQNLHHSDILSFEKLLSICVELLWKAQDNKLASLIGNKDNKRNELIFQTTKLLFSAILDTNGVFGVLVSRTHGQCCLKRILFDLNMINRIEKEELFKAEDAIVTLVETCSEHKDSRVLEGLPMYKACTALLETFRNCQSDLNSNRNSLPPMLHEMVELDKEEPETNLIRAASNSAKIVNDLTPLSVQEERYLRMLEMTVPRNQSDLPNLLRSLKQRKIDLFTDLMRLLPCGSCHRQALIHFSPDKYSYLMEDLANMGCLPFEFDEDDKLGPWDILLSENTIKDIRQLKSPLVANTVVKKLWKISSGKWNKHGFRHEVSNTTIPVYETEIPGNSGLRIVWQIDYGFSGRNYSLMQLVKVWAVTDSEKIHRILETLAAVHQFYTTEHHQRLEIQQIAKDDIILPRIFENEEELRSADKKSQMDDEKLLEVHKIYTNKFIPFSKKLCKSLVLGGTDFTFQVSKIEYEIIKNPRSAIIIGRSGTGKTTCILFKLLASYLGGFNKRQIFITVSRNLCRRVNDYFNRMRESAELSRKNMTTEEFHEYAKTKEEEDNVADGMLEEEDEELDMSNIPNSFHKLTDHHFPLFVTYQKFSQMLRGTYGMDSRKTQKLDVDIGDEEELHQGSSFVNTSDASWAHFVDYNLFKRKYWPRLTNYKLDRQDCELVYSEFSIIKGLSSKDSKGGYLSKEDYRDASIKKYPAFCHNRDKIYDLFLRYEKLKAQSGDYDLIDRTLAILRYANMKALGGPQIHEVYIDECQDNHIVDLKLILKVFDCANAIILSGDIAQCIARGSVFRFEDLSALIYQWESNRINRIQDYNKHDIIKPKQFELNTNYRSHDRILQLASSVIDLIRQFFPNSIDRLPRECGEISGPLPIIFNGFETETFHFDIFSKGNQNYVEFGAEQVIIVRDEEAKLRLRKLIGKAGLVMTVFETKGMEFNDVLLYNFFKDSSADLTKWRIIPHVLNDHPNGTQVSYMNHFILSTELKHLYVAVTRARQRIWIFDEDDYLKPIQTYWEHHKLVKVIKKGEEIPTLAKESNLHDWNEQGKRFFEQQQYDQAIFCFEKSKNDERYKLAVAYHLQQIARDSVHDSDDATVKSNFIDAAQAFIKCSRPNKAAICYENIMMYEEAGDIYVQCDMFESAARCYLKADMWYEAGKYFEKSKKYTEAVLAYKDGGYYEIVIDLMQKHRQEIDKKIFHRITRLVNIYYRRKNDKKMSEKALSILSTEEEQIELLRSHAPEELLEVCEKSGQFRAAAEDLRSRNRFEEAANMFIRSVDNDEDIIEALKCLLHLCRISILKETMADIASPNTLQELLFKATEIIKRGKSQRSLKKSGQWKNLTEEIQLYSAYLKKDPDRINMCIKFFRERKEFATEFRAVKIWLQILPQFNIQVEYWYERLQYILRLCELAFPFINLRQNFTDTEKISEVFEDIFFVNKVKDRPRERKISKEIFHLIDDEKDVAEIIDDWYVYDMDVIHLKISKFLSSYISKCILEAGKNGRSIPDISFPVCYKFASCQKQNCRNHHVTPTPSILHQRLTLACLQYTVMRQLDLLYRRRLLKDEQSAKVLGAQRWWAEKLVKAHIRYQSPQISCPEVTYMMLAELPQHARNGLISLANKKWLPDTLKENDFEVMLKCMFVFQQLRDKWCINKFYWEMKKTMILSHPSDLPTGFEYYHGYYQAVPVGKRLSLFFSSLNSNNVIFAIRNAKTFIGYAINNAEQVNLITCEAFSDLVFLMEFTMSLTFAVGSRPCRFYLPRAYLVNYFNAFTAVPLIPGLRRALDRIDYLNEIGSSINQIQQLLEQLIGKGVQIHLTIILRLIRLLVLISLNESTFVPSVFNLFNYLNSKVNSIKIKNYLSVTNTEHLKVILHNDLKETGCDSLVIVNYYSYGALSEISNLGNGIVELTYNTIEGFHSALQQIISPVVTKTTATNNQQKSEENTGPMLVDDNYNEEDDDTSFEEAQELATEIQAWFRQIHGSLDAREAAKKIQVWLRRVHNRQKSRQLNYDPTHKIYNDMMVFCQNAFHWEIALNVKGKKAVHKYHILLRGLTVETVVKLIKMQIRMDTTKNKLQKTINDHSIDEKRLESCLELEDDLKDFHYKNVKLALESLSAENVGKHEKVNIEWLKNELQQADTTINQVEEWINKCETVMNFGQDLF